MIKFLHTADWQIGMTRHFLKPEAQARFSAARLDAITTMAAIASRERCQFTLRLWRRVRIEPRGKAPDSSSLREDKSMA